jgi:hypothetical protein
MEEEGDSSVSFVIGLLLGFVFGVILTLFYAQKWSD